jgi:hypothetical protein
MFTNLVSRLIVVGIVAIPLTACTESDPNSATLDRPTIATNTNPAIPPLEAKNSTIDCSGWSDGALTFIRGQGQIVINDVLYGVATFACGLPNSELGTEFVESFVYAENVWAANGLVAGPDLPFMTSAPCISGKEIVCPAFSLDLEKGEEVSGNVVVFQKDGGLAWRFDPAS